MYKNKIFKTLTLVVGLLVLFSAADLQARRSKSAKVNLKKYVKLIKKKAEFKQDFKVYETDKGRFAVSGEGNDLRLIVLTGDYAEIKGYRGWTNCFILMDKECRVMDVKVVDSMDTPPYVKRVVKKGYLNNFIDHKYKEGASEHHRGRHAHRKGHRHGHNRHGSVDAVSGATMTSDAIKASVEKSLEEFKKIFAALKFKAGEPVSDNKEISIKKIS